MSKLDSDDVRNIVIRLLVDLEIVSSESEINKISYKDDIVKRNTIDAIAPLMSSVETI